MYCLNSISKYLGFKPSEKIKQKSGSGLKSNKTYKQPKNLVGQQNAKHVTNGKSNRRKTSHTNNSRYNNQVGRCQRSHFNNFPQFPRYFNQRDHANYQSHLISRYDTQNTNVGYPGYQHHQNELNCFRDDYRRKNFNDDVRRNNFRRNDHGKKVFDRYYWRNDFDRNDFGSNDFGRNGVRRNAMRRIITRRCETRRVTMYCRANGSRMTEGNQQREFYRISENSRSYYNHCQENFRDFRTDDCFQYEQFSDSRHVDEWSIKSRRYNFKFKNRYHPY